ncbi:MAG: hypothetical protein IKY10_04230 [Clostridia bacterium]|nr:hypothetical protein [Clostridia bacterium]
MKNENEKFLVSNVYLFYDLNKRKLIATQNENYPGVPFVCSPITTTASARYAFRMYPTNNLYYIISNLGNELTKQQINALINIRSKVVGDDLSSRIENEKTATLTRKEIHDLVNEIDEYVSKHQIKIMSKKQDLDNSII